MESLTAWVQRAEATSSSLHSVLAQQADHLQQLASVVRETADRLHEVRGIWASGVDRIHHTLTGSLGHLPELLQQSLAALEAGQGKIAVTLERRDHYLQEVADGLSILARWGNPERVAAVTGRLETIAGHLAQVEAHVQRVHAHNGFRTLLGKVLGRR